MIVESMLREELDEAVEVHNGTQQRYNRTLRPSKRLTPWTNAWFDLATAIVIAMSAKTVLRACDISCPAFMGEVNSSPQELAQLMLSSFGLTRACKHGRESPNRSFSALATPDAIFC